jgi:hypothetical protein
MQSAIIAPVKFDTPTKRTRPEDTTSSSARMVSSNGVEASGQCTSSTSTQSVRSRFRLRSISRKMLARLASRSGPSWPGGGGFTPHLVTRITSPAALLEGARHDFLRVATAVRRRGVHAVHTLVERAVDRLDGLVVLDRAVAVAGHRPAAKAQRGYLQPGSAERTKTHGQALRTGE